MLRVQCELAGRPRAAANEQLKLEKWVLEGLAPAIKHSGTEVTHVNFVHHSLARSSHRSSRHPNTNKAKV